MVDFEHFHTLLPQSVGSKNGAVAPTITSSAAFGYENAEQAEGIFNGEVEKPLYARMGNPTNTHLESILSKIEDAEGAIVTSSGMGAISMVLTAYLKSGDAVLCIGGFFGGTYTLMTETMPRFGISADFCDVDDFEFIEQKLQNGVAMVLVESIGNPNLKLPNIKKISTLCTQYNTLLLVDNTATPLLLQPLKMGADILIYSTTKNISGHSASLGGVALFRAIKEEDKLKTDKYKHLHKIVEKVGNKAMIAISKKRALRDFGMSANAFGSFITMLGLETLSLRIERVSKSSEIIAKTLDKKLENISVRHPSLNTHEHHNLYREIFPSGCGSLLTLDAGTKENAFKLLNNTKLITQTANIGDNRTLALHMKSTIYSDFHVEDLKILGITDGLIRVSIGLENPQDIINDFIQASKFIN
jgi:O-acetylhomoserine (thiol)-lyase